jgi:hypothetical protein
MAIVQRPASNKGNIDLQSFEESNGVYTSQTFTIPKEGRWNIAVKVTIDGVTGYATRKTFVKSEKR